MTIVILLYIVHIVMTIVILLYKVHIVMTIVILLYIVHTADKTTSVTLAPATDKE